MTKASLSGRVHEWKPWTQVAPHDPDQDQPVGDPTTEEIDGATRTVQRKKITRTPDTIVTFNPNTDMLYPGAILRSDEAIDKGFLVSAGIEATDRAPLTVSIDVLNSGASRTVEHPDYGKVIDAIKDAVKGGKSQSPSYIFEKTVAHESTQVALELGISAKYLGASGSFNIKADYTSQTSTVMGYLRLKAFTATCSLNTPDDLVNDDFTEDKLDRLVADGLVGESNPPLIVSDVYYGQLLMFTMTARESSAQIKAALDASYRGFVDVDASLKAEYQRIIGETEIKVLSRGGDPGRVQTLLDGGKLSDYFKTDEPMEQYVPIGYALKTLDGYPAKMSETADYDDVAWKPARDWQGAIDAVMFFHGHYWLFKGDQCLRTNPPGHRESGPLQALRRGRLARPGRHRVRVRRGRRAEHHSRGSRRVLVLPRRPLYEACDGLQDRRCGSREDHAVVASPEGHSAKSVDRRWRSGRFRTTASRRLQQVVVGAGRGIGRGRQEPAVAAGPRIPHLRRLHAGKLGLRAGCRRRHPRGGDGNKPVVKTPPPVLEIPQLHVAGDLILAPSWTALMEAQEKACGMGTAECDNQIGHGNEGLEDAVHAGICTANPDWCGKAPGVPPIKEGDRLCAR